MDWALLIIDHCSTRIMHVSRKLNRTTRCHALTSIGARGVKSAPLWKRTRHMIIDQSLPRSERTPLVFRDDTVAGSLISRFTRSPRNRHTQNLIGKRRYIGTIVKVPKTLPPPFFATCTKMWHKLAFEVAAQNGLLCHHHRHDNARKYITMYPSRTELDHTIPTVCNDDSQDWIERLPLLSTSLTSISRTGEPRVLSGEVPNAAATLRPDA